jgi:putative glycosyltransferase (TIGR04372 family)
MRRQFISASMAFFHAVFRMLPAELDFAVLAICEQLRLPGRRLTNRAYVPIAAWRLLRKPDRRLSSLIAWLLPRSSISVLYDIGQFRECAALIEASAIGLLSAGTNRMWGNALFELGEFDRARQVLDALASKRQLVAEPHSAFFKGHLDLIVGRPDTAVENFEFGVRHSPFLLCPHQNLAAHYSSAYEPIALDVLSGPDGRLFDAYNYIGQRVTHVGMGQLGAQLYAGALAAQKRLGATAPPVTAELEELLYSLGISLDELRILPVEWYTQVGHQGMLDMLFRMRELGWWHGKAVFLMPHDSVANDTFQRLFERYGHVLIPGGNIGLAVAAELFSLQRWYGMGFNAFELSDGCVVPWQEAGAEMMVRWEEAGLGSPARQEYDRLYGTNDTVLAVAAKVAQLWGMKPGDWHVCLHMREATHYGELSGTGQTHRNAAVDEYLQAIEHVTACGGWVIRLGGPRSPRLPRMKRVIDYARSSFKSHLMDVHLIRNARFFIGTTSGLTNVAVSMGVPCALVNCITTDAQLWHSDVRFALKRLQLSDGSFATQHQLTSTPWRWRSFGADVLGRHGAVLVNSTADEILEAVKEVDALAAGEAERYTGTIPGAADLLAQWRKSLSMQYYYGAARPSVYYLHKHASMINQTVSEIHDHEAADNVERIVAARTKLKREVSEADSRTPTKPSAHAF